VPASDPIGVFDSGVGGLSVLREIRRELPGEDLVYLADSAYAPYGDRSADFIAQRAGVMLQSLEAEHAKAVVVACNTVTGVAIEGLRARFSMPIVAMEPAVKPAAALTRSGVIAVLATSGTLSSSKFSTLVSRFGVGVEVLIQPSPRLVEQVEKGDVASGATRSLVEAYVRPLVAQGADVIVLGCTHFPFLSDLIQEVAGLGVTVIDPAVAVAREVRRRLEMNQTLAVENRRGTERFWTTGSPTIVRPVMAGLWGADIDVSGLPKEISE
jgi:glutamate racemase